jgi:hypothetical protein
MGTITLKGRGRQGKAIPDGKADGKGEVNTELSNGDGETGGTGLEASGNADTKGKISYSGLVGLVQSHNEKLRPDIINRAWHPEATEGANIQTIISDVPVLQGKAAYQLSTGEIIEV